jgi:NTP pyrophosphatase (non-canonical NTP hydrolase)
VKDLICDEFQNTVSKYLVRHQSILDILSKIQESSARVNRATVKAVTTCGCLQIHAVKKEIPPDASFDDFAITKLLDNNLEGKICPDCKDTLENELGKTLFYLVALCNAMDLNLYDVILKEHKKLSTLRIFNLT